MIGSSDNPTSAVDLARRRVVYADGDSLRRGRSRGIEIQVFEDYPLRFTGLIHLPAGTLLPPDPARHGTEILVFEGQVEFDGVLLGQHGYARRPGQPAPVVTATTDTILFVKRGHIPPEDDFETVLEPRAELWKGRQAGELKTLALHHHGGIAVSLMRYQPGTAAVVRRRIGGEEILVLDGTLLDERSAYPRGTWIRNPPGSLHEPYSVEGCLIYLQTGHLPII
jgi:ChrR Cupin-like domain